MLYNKHFPCFLFFLFWTIFPLFAQKSGIKGRIKDQDGKAIPFASIGVEKIALGTMANENGDFKLAIPSGTYTIYFQCLGFKTQKKEVEISGTFFEMDLILEEVAIQTKEVTIGSRGGEDPAYSIMRKAIARAKINKLLLDAYTAQVYIKGSARILDLPFLLKPMAKANGFDENTVFFTETLELLEFKQPGQYKEKVIAARSTFGNIKVSQRFITADLYSPKFGSTISPLSPASFRYYKFQYIGSFSDRDHDVFKIKVVPRTKGQNLWSGELYLIDKIWNIHSAHLSGNVEGFDLVLSHIYSPLEGIWLPVQLQEEIRGTVLQIKVEAKYNASVSKYKIKKNEKLYADFQKLEQELDEKVNEAFKTDPVNVDYKSLEKADKKILRKLAKEYIKEKYGLRRKEKNKPKVSSAVVSEYNYEVDSAATKKDSIFWLENRAVPLTEMEIKSFHKLDSIRIKEEIKDSSKAKRKRKEGALSVFDLILGREFYFGKKDSLGRKPFRINYFSPINDLTFNPVEGFALETTIWFKRYLRQSINRQKDDRPFIQFGPTVRYSFGREKLIGSGVFQYVNSDWAFQLSGGTNMRQINGEDPVSASINSSYAYLDTRNFLKLYEADFGKIQVLRKLDGRFELEGSLEWINRIPVSNTREKGKWGKSKSFEPNQFLMPFSQDAVLDRSVATIASAQVDWYPSLQSSIYNGNQYFRSASSPRFRLKINHAIPSIFNSTAEFTSAIVSYRQSVSLSPKSNFEIFGQVGQMLLAPNLGQMDALHLYGNQTFILGSNKVEQFRNLPYYNFSSQKSTASLHLHLYRGEMVFGWLARKKKNWQELILINGMANANQPLFWEVGYGLDKLFRFLHVEVVRSQFENTKGEWRFMLGGTFDFKIQAKSYEKAKDDFSF